MSENDLESVAALDVSAFSEIDQLTGRVDPISPRTVQNLQASLNLNPTGCFIAEADEPIGYLFSRIWGKMGWIGVFGVDPAHQGMKVGQALLTAAIEQLKKSGCESIGLETRSDKTYNVGFYTGRGFRLTFPTLGMTRLISPPPDPAPYVSLSALEEPDALCAVSQVSEAVQSGLDYAPEAENANNYRWGETLFFGWPSTWAFTVIRTVSRRKGNAGKICEIDVLAIHPDYVAYLEQVLQSVDRFAFDQGIPQVRLSINTADGNTLKRILDQGFRVDSIMLRMTLDHQIRLPPQGIDLSRWAM